MQNVRVYILQFIGIVLLLCGYFLSDQPDSLSVMHFDPRAHSVITTTTKSTPNEFSAQTVSLSRPDSHRRIHAPKYVSFELLMPIKANYVFLPQGAADHGEPLPENYRYLFYREINPPPPKVS